ncbi:RsfA family transcriptional regulator [Aneurinibacillus sp. Ricciae_BoGa-3]|uniref:RsfA family transcriptional regulator n=1 Tax=Aneurinibacillus sp. Ricciae_BoGa-3 TaxID=3022697 RepID=UPI0023400D65|nr:RsfA family transcriptional regulator [Aneurinibacillus sp. Ricciae_BoGa-3]WCK53100.1 RsfA family transcriptional regulator [Aneurinibacillus sp. Ricciae_BoGa-3]
MTATRQDAWTPDDDLLLAEVTLRRIRDGSTQLAAFEEVGQKLGRTAAACGFRWNSWVRKKYETAIQIAKAQRQQRKKTTVIEDIDSANTINEDVRDIEEVQPIETPAAKSVYYPPARSTELEEDISFETVIRFLRSQKEVHKRTRQLEKEILDKTKELEQLREENARMRMELTEIQSDYQIVNNDYKALIQIMDRARKMAFLVDEEEMNGKPRFKMDANGNLERVE